MDAAEAHLAIYLAGADPFEDDRLGRLCVTKSGLAERDNMVLEACRERGISVALTMAGGYARRVADTVDVHFQSIRRAADTLELERGSGRGSTRTSGENVTAGPDSCLVVGAGISGLLAARELQAEGWRVTVLDKRRGVGGRMATRRVGEGNFDHGAQFFTVRGERFADLVEGWLAAGAAEGWTRGFAEAAGEVNENGHRR